MDKIKIYNKQFPIIGELVIVKIIEINDFFRTLLIEYNTSAIMSFSQVPKKIFKGIKVDQILVTEVISSENGSINLSMMNVSKESIDLKKDNYQKNKHIISIIYEVSYLTNIDVEIINNYIINYSYDQLGEMSKNKDLIQESEYSETLFKVLQKHFKKDLEFIKKIKITCYNSNGINGIINSLKKAEEIEGIKIHFVSSPYYNIICNKENGDKLIDYAINIIKTEINNYGGNLELS